MPERQGMSAALRRGRVSAILWERDGSVKSSRSLLHEVDFFTELGMATYIVGAQVVDQSLAFDLGQTLGPVIRVTPDLYFGEFFPKCSHRPGAAS